MFHLQEREHRLNVRDNRYEKLIEMFASDLKLFVDLFHEPSSRAAGLMRFSLAGFKNPVDHAITIFFRSSKSFHLNWHETHLSRE